MLWSESANQAFVGVCWVRAPHNAASREATKSVVKDCRMSLENAVHAVHGLCVLTSQHGFGTSIHWAEFGMFPGGRNHQNWGLQGTDSGRIGVCGCRSHFSWRLYPASHQARKNHNHHKTPTSRCCCCPVSVLFYVLLSFMLI